MALYQTSSKYQGSIIKDKNYKPLNIKLITCLFGKNPMIPFLSEKLMSVTIFTDTHFFL